jgi:polar amino acid transport system substrate-binding protein
VFIRGFIPFSRFRSLSSNFAPLPTGKLFKTALLQPIPASVTLGLMKRLLSLALLFLAACSPAPDGATAPLRVGMDPTYPPFETKDPSGAVTGVSADLAAMIAERLGRPLEIVPMDFQGLLPALKSDKIDLIISSMTKTEERARQVAFSDPYVETGLAILVPQNSAVTSLEDLRKPGTKIVVRTGTTGHTFAIAQLPEANLLPQELTETCVAEVANGNVEAFLYDQLSVLAYAEKQPDRLKALPEPFQKEFWAIALRPEDQELLTSVNEALAGFRTEGGFAKLLTRYPDLAKRHAQMQAMGLDFLFDIK